MNMSDERLQIERLHALLAAFEAETEADESLELTALAEEIRLLRLGVPRPRLSAERRARAREQALQAFHARWASPSPLTAEDEQKEEELPTSSMPGLDQKTLRRIQEELANAQKAGIRSQKRWKQATKRAPTRPALKPVCPEPVGEQEPSESFWRRLRLPRRQLFKVLGLAGLATLFKGLFTRAYTLPSAPATVAGGISEAPLQAMTVKAVMPDPVRGMTSPLLLLEAANMPGRMLPIWIGQPEARAISLVLEGQTFPRPMTHELLLKALEAVGTRLDHVRITRIEGGTYYAAIVLRDGEGGLRAVDARPSDAVALALRAGCPVYTVDEVLEQGGISIATPAEEDEWEGE